MPYNHFQYLSQVLDLQTKEELFLLSQLMFPGFFPTEFFFNIWYSWPSATTNRVVTFCFLRAYFVLSK